MESSLTTSKWGTAGWWTIVTLSVPFAVYASLFASGDFNIYKHLTINWNSENYDIAGLNIMHHIRAWQVHSVAAIIFVFIGPFQFNSSFRKKNPTIHRLLGYVFVATGTVIPISGIVFMNPHSEFGIFGRTVFFVQGLFMLYCLLFAVWMARQKKFKVHQKYMIRGAATGYSVIAVRLFIPLLALSGVEFWLSVELAALLAPLVFLFLAELYIRTILSQKPRQTSKEAEGAAESDILVLNFIDKEAGPESP